MGKLTYWDVVKKYQRELYKSKLYWLGALLIVLGFIVTMISFDYVSAIGSLVIGFILIIVSKIKVLRMKVK